jgi:AcrR family transcriptional regulator
MPKATPYRDRSTPFYVLDDDPPAKRKILVTALSLFVRDGLCETSVRDIADASGFTNPALFKHFKTKDDLARFLFERCYLELARLVEDAIASSTNFSEQQRGVIDAYLDALDRDSDSVLYVQDFLRHFWPSMPATVKRRSIIGGIRRMLKAGRENGAVTTAVDVDLLSTAWIGTLQQVARVKYFGELKAPSTRELADSIETLLSRMVNP